VHNTSMYMWSSQLPIICPHPWSEVEAKQEGMLVFVLTFFSDRFYLAVPSPNGPPPPGGGGGLLGRRRTCKLHRRHGGDILSPHIAAGGGAILHRNPWNTPSAAA